MFAGKKVKESHGKGEVESKASSFWSIHNAQRQAIL
jgi:hypothetical protein